MQMTLHGKQTHTHKSETRKQQRTLRKSYHTHTYTQKRTKKTIKSFAVTLTPLLMSHCSKDPYSRFTHTRVCGRIVWAINLSGGDASHHRGHHFVEGGNNENCTHSYTLKDALIKHGSKN
uniref:(northern house mosquito) hypothetical protein n=1 Tax=Culex pipiens TaxID=7175 RepID=A0A8D8G733_CULPI